MGTAPPDSELQHSFGPGEALFDFLPLEVPKASDLPLPTSPREALPVLDLNSSGPLPAMESSPANGSPSHAASAQPGRFWLDGDAILCACPDCRAPMSVRIWLMVAECWRCGASIELSDEQEREIQRLIAERERQRHAAAPPAPPTSRPIPRTPSVATPPPLPPPTPSTHRSPAAAPARPPAPSTVVRSPAPQRPAAPPARSAPQPILRREPWLRHLLNATPAWLISMLVHLILLTVLALFTTEGEEEAGPFITLSTMTSREVTDGGDTLHIKPDDLAKFDLPLPNKADLLDDKKREALLAASQDARELRLDEDPPYLPDVEVVKQKVGQADGYAQALAARDPRLRVEMVTKEGGTTLTEAAVARGLQWLANHQNTDGSWSLSGFRKAGDCNCGADGSYKTKSPGTALAMLPYLGAGQTHLAGKYKGTVSRGLRWMIENQKEDGDLRAGAHGNEGMYTHGQATIVLCEAFAMTGDEALRVPAQRAVDFVVKAQYRDGGWRYSPGPPTQRGDTSVVGWQLMALQSARSANLTVPTETWAMADHYLDSVQHDGGAKYSYQASREATHVMTAEGLLCRMYLGWTNDRPGLTRGVDWLTNNHPPSSGRPNIYYWYYATQVMHHHGGPQWEDWNLQMRDVLVDSQETQGHAAGSWDPKGEHASAGGRIYMTSLAICTLEVYYRHLPIFRQIDLAR